MIYTGVLLLLAKRYLRGCDKLRCLRDGRNMVDARNSVGDVLRKCRLENRKTGGG